MYLKTFLLLSVLIPLLNAAEINSRVVATKHNKNLTLGELVEIQPGLGTIMMEFGQRYYIAYYGAKAGNWALAEYEIKELIEAQEIAEATRPEYSKDLKAFEHGALSKLQKRIKKREWSQFEKEYARTTDACNACHKKHGHPYIYYQLPKEPPRFLRMKLEE